MRGRMQDLRLAFRALRAAPVVTAAAILSLGRRANTTIVFLVNSLPLRPLGAAPAGIIGLVLSRVLRLVGFGVLVGVGVSMWASKFVASLLYGLEPRDPATLIGAAVVSAAVGALAGGWPAWRASRIEPAKVLRDA